METVEKITLTEKSELIEKLISFLGKIGIKVQEGIIETETFLPGLQIKKDALVIDKAKLKFPGDILHEAGHIAVTAAAKRAKLDGNIMMGKPQNEGEELAAMLWSYAACKELGLPPEIVFHKDGYKGDSDWLLNNYANNTFIGLPLLRWMGMASEFPVMLKWLRD